MNKIKKHDIFRQGFTIVELLIVIVVIGVLAAISFVAYSGVQRSATDSSAKDTLSKAVKAMKLAGIQAGSFDTAFPSNIKVSGGIGIALTEVGDSQTFCINVTSQKYDDILWHADKNGVITEGLCEGAVIATSILGDYNSAAGPQAEPSYSIANGDGGGFVVQTTDDWSALTLSWDAVPDASRYEVQSRTSTTGDESTWRLSSIATGGGNYPVSIQNQNNTSLSAQISFSSSSITWNNAAYMMPQSAGSTYQYRIRIKSNIVKNLFSDWIVVNLSTPDVSGAQNMASSFTATPSGDWSTITFSWTSPISNGTPQPRYEIQSRTSDSGTWRLSSIASGGGNYTVTPQTQSSALYSAQIPYTDSSITWNNTTYMGPQASGQTYQYRIRIKTNIISNLFSDWLQINLSR